MGPTGAGCGLWATRPRWQIKLLADWSEVGVEPLRAGRSDVGMPEVYHESVYFSGRVQGVGFRYQTLQVAKEFEVSGFVQNLGDGRVLLEIEGGESELGGFVDALEGRMAGYVRKVERHSSMRAAQYRGFSMK